MTAPDEAISLTELVRQWAAEPGQDEPTVRGRLARLFEALPADPAPEAAWVVDVDGRVRDGLRVRRVDLVGYLHGSQDLLFGVDPLRGKRWRSGPALDDAALLELARARRQAGRRPRPHYQDAAYPPSCAIFSRRWLREELARDGKAMPAVLAAAPATAAPMWPGFPNAPKTNRDEWTEAAQLVAERYWRRHRRIPPGSVVWRAFGTPAVRDGLLKDFGITVDADGQTARMREEAIAREVFLKRYRAWMTPPPA